MGNNPLVSIMIPVYNRENLIEETLLSALQQDFEDFEVVVVDNCSTDRTYEILKEYAIKFDNLRVYQNEENLGPVLNWKAGIEKSKGKYLKILWSDDKISVNFLKCTVKILEHDPQVGFVYTGTIIKSNTTERCDYIWGESGKYSSQEFIRAHYTGLKSVPLSPGNGLFKTDDVKKSLVINIENSKKLDFKFFGAGNDVLIYLFIAKQYKYFYFINENLTIFKAHEGSLSIKNDLQEYYLIAKIFYLEKNKEILSKSQYNSFYSKIFSTDRYKYLVQNIDFNLNYLFVIKREILRIRNLINM